MVNGYRQQIEKDTHLEALGPIPVKVCFAPERLSYLQRANLSLGLVLVVRPLLVCSLSELVLLDHDCIVDIIDIDTVDKSIRNSRLSIKIRAFSIYPDR